MTRTLITADKIVPLDPNDSLYEPGYLIVEDGRIVALGDAASLDAAQTFDGRVDLGKKLVMPGLVNAHTHSPMSLFRGLAEGHTLFSLEGWYNTIRVVEHVLKPEMLPAAVAVSCAEMIHTGTICFADQYLWMDRVVPEVPRAGCARRWPTASSNWATRKPASARSRQALLLGRGLKGLAGGPRPRQDVLQSHHGTAGFRRAVVEAV